MINLYLRILENFKHLILQDGFHFVHKPLVRMVKFKLLTRFPVDHLHHPVVSCFILFLATLQHSLIMWLIILSLSPRYLHLLFCCALSIFAFSKTSCMKFRLFVAWNIHTIAFLSIFVFWLLLLSESLCGLSCFRSL